MLQVSVPSTNSDRAMASRSTPRCVALLAVNVTLVMPAMPKNRYMVVCCQFISFTHESVLRS